MASSQTPEQLESQAQEAQDNADKHHDSAYIILIVCTLSVDLLGALGFGTLALILAPAVWLLNGFLWLSQRELWQAQDYATALVTSIMESIPGVDILPAATANAIQKWMQSAARAQANQSMADSLFQQAEKLRRKQA